jgi:hypothetical protein
MKSWSWILLIGAAITVRFASTQSIWIEENFSTNIYPMVSRIQRAILGWIPFSLGDIFYGFLVVVILFKTGQLIKAIFKKKVNRQFLLSGLRQLIFFYLFVYVFFYGLWGLNYNRQGITYQLGLEIKPYTQADIDTVTIILHQRLNSFATTVNEKQRDSFNRKKLLFEKAAEAYLFASEKYSFLDYTPQSLKPSLFSYLGNYFGFQGYYNPFSGEGQVNTMIPRTLEPFVTVHEIAHQIGYAKENEANFVAFIACRNYPSVVYRYSMYFDMYRYAIRELHSRDSMLAKKYQEGLHPQVKKDYKELKDFFMRNKNPIEPIIMNLYGSYLKANHQPEGKKTYNQVVAFLIAYYKKNGADAL